MANVRTPVSPLYIAELRQRGNFLAEHLLPIAQADRYLHRAMLDKLVGLDYRTTLITVALDRTRCTIELYHRSELGETYAQLLKLVRRRARKMPLGLDTVTLEDRQTYADAVLVPQNTWIFGALPGQTGVTPLTADRLFPAAFLLPDLEVVRYSHTFTLSEEQLLALENLDS